MAFKTKPRFTAVFLAVTMLAGIFATGFTYQPGIGNVYSETRSEIYENASYHQQLAGHETNGIIKPILSTRIPRVRIYNPMYLKVKSPAPIRWIP